MTYSPRSKSNRIGMTVTVFVYLYSGYVLYCPFYGGENALLEYIVTSLFTLAAALVSSSFFSKRKAAGKRHASPYFAVVISVILAVLSSAYIALYTSLLGIFGEDYPTPLAALFFAAVIIAGGVMGAEKGRICVLSFCRMVLLPLVTVAIAGCFAFFTTKSAFLLPSPFASFSDGEFFHLPLSIAYLSLDITFLSAILTDNESGEVRKASVQSVMKGTSLFVLFSGLCTAKNLMLFGEAYASEMISADLAALRLVPMFDLAEIAVVVNTLACQVKVLSYACLAFFSLKDAFGDGYSSRAAKYTFFAVSFAVSAVLFIFTPGENPFSTTFIPVLTAICAAFCFALCSKPENRQNNTR